MTASGQYTGPIKLVLFDVDGVLTDGSLYYDALGEALKVFNARDGFAVALLRAHGLKSGVLSGKDSPALNHRISHLGFDVSFTGRIDKRRALEEIAAEFDLRTHEIAYVGDDVVDLVLLASVGVFYAPADAHELVLTQATHVLLSRGGRGAAREAAEHILGAGGLDLTEVYAPLILQWDRGQTVQ